MPQISVVIPAYNAARWIAETIESVLVQTFQDFEIIVVDDGSTDETAEAVTKFKRVKCIHQENSGLSSARNTGIRAAMGEYIAFIDADDLWLHDKLDAQMTRLKQTRFAWVYSDAFAFDGESHTPLFIFSQMRKQHEGEVLQSLLLEDFIPMPTPILKRHIFDEVGFFTEDTKLHSAEDWDMWLRTAARYPVGFVKRPLAMYRVHPTSMIQSALPSVLYNANLNVIELAVSREPSRLANLKNRAVSRSSVRIGQMCVRRNDLHRARGMFAQAIRLSPSHVSTYAYWLGTFAGRRLTQGYVKLLLWLRRKHRDCKSASPSL
jgi:glycosyltransferase involved in cell wall biosynthesis